VLDRPLGGVVGSATEADPRLVVEVWLAVPTDDGWRVLMLRRSEAHGPFWQGVSGRVEPDDPTLRAAAAREIREETGLAGDVPLLDLGPWVAFKSAYSERWYRKRPLGARLPASATPAGIRLSAEHVEARLTTFAEARALVQWPGNEEALAALERAVAGDP
jgi:8-oxo-dGTP pyrophosphatase MutT (NUDIX family)